MTEPDVSKNLGAAVQICRAGNRIVLDLDTGSYILNKATRKYTPLFVRNNTFKYRLWVRKRKPAAKAKAKAAGAEAAQYPAAGKMRKEIEKSDKALTMSIGVMSQGQRASSSSFPRQALHWP